jgi:asparagine synthase (glutamine-hydrolysing)
VGVTLSGGIDSSAIASIMKQHLSEGQSLKILSAVSPGQKEDESMFIDIMSDFLKNPVEKVDLSCSPNETFKLMRKVIWHNDAPIGSLSNVAHFLLMREAHSLGITVILSGQGADELLCGYKKYLGFYIQSLIAEKRFFQAFKLLVYFIFNGSILNQFNFREAKRYLPNSWKKNDLNITGPALKDYKSVQVGMDKNISFRKRQINDLKKFSVPFLTHYEDRMSMAWSREIRLPFLDFRLIEFLTKLPTNLKISRGWTKYLFRKSTENFLPKEIVWRKDKQGFSIPQEKWLKNELRDKVLSTFKEDALIFQLGLVNRSALLKNYSKFCNQPAEKGSIWYRDIFNPLALEIWLQSFRDYIEIND